jgi:ribosomal protein S27E
MPVVTCANCGERVFTITGWADLDHCPACGRVLAPEGRIAKDVREQIRREAGRFTRKDRRAAKRRVARSG